MEYEVLRLDEKCFSWDTESIKKLVKLEYKKKKKGTIESIQILRPCGKVKAIVKVKK